MASTKPVIVGLTNDNLSTNFKYKEVVFSADAQRNNIDNLVYDTEYLLNAKALANNVLEKVRAHFFPLVNHGITINSWYRCAALEKQICRSAFVSWCAVQKLDPAKSESWNTYFLRKSHPKCCAADIEVVGVTNIELFTWINANLKFDQLILEFVNPKVAGSGWVHVSWNRTGTNRQQAFSIG